MASKKQDYEQIVNDLIAEHGEKRVYKMLAEAGGYETVPPTMHEFIYDSEYLGDIYGFDNENKRPTMYPYWEKALEEIYPDPFNSRYNEIILTGATGQGKSTAAIIGTLRDLAVLLLVKNPHGKYGIAKNTKIVFSLMNATKTQAKGVLYDQMMTAIHTSPFFKSKMVNANKYTLFEKNIDIDFGSRSDQMLGRAVAGAILSEFNFANKVANQAKDLYTGMMTRWKSRFQSQSAPPGRIWVDSSATGSDSFINEIVLKDKSEAELKKLKIYNEKRWEVLPDWRLPEINYYFDVFRGSDTKDPFVIEKEDQKEGLDTDAIISVPDFYYDEFVKNTREALQNVAGISTESSYRFFPSRERIDSAIKHKNPINSDSVAVDFYDQEDILIKHIQFDHILKDARPKFIHFDLAYSSSSSGDRAGVAACRLHGIRTLKRLDSATGKIIVINEPVFYIDFAFGVHSKPNQEIPLYKLENFCVDLRSKGYKIAYVSLDGFQSAMMRQNLILKGFKSEIVSVDKTIDPYVELKQAINMDKIALPENEILKGELQKLEMVKGRKVDHPLGGSKDIADSVCGAVFTAKNKMVEMQANITPDQIVSALQNITKPNNMYDSLKDQMGLFHR